MDRRRSPCAGEPRGRASRTYDLRPMPLLAYPNVSEGRDAEAIAQIGAAFGDGLLDVHSDVDHHRSAYTLAGEPGRLAAAVVSGAAEAISLIRIDDHDGVHPRVGAVDVAPIVYLDDADRGAACAEALVLADRLAAGSRAAGVPLRRCSPGGRTRAELRRGGSAELRRRIAAGELEPDFGPPVLHPTAGAVLVAARPPLVAFNVELAPPATVQDAKRIAALIREGGAGGAGGPACHRPVASEHAGLRAGVDQRRGPPRDPAGRCRRRCSPPRRGRRRRARRAGPGGGVREIPGRRAAPRLCHDRGVPSTPRRNA